LEKESQLLKELYPIALELQDLAPWQWMCETDLFGVKLPDLDTPYFASIMGSSGQFNAVSFYDGVHAANQFLHIQEHPGATRPEDIMLIPHLMVSFDDRKFLQPDERIQIEELGYDLKERNQWPVFQQIIPGHPHLFPAQDKLRNLIPLLEQTLHIARRTRHEEFVFMERTKEGVAGLFRFSEAGQWRDEYTEMSSTYEPAPIPASGRLAAQLNRIPKRELVLEVDLAMMLSPVMDRDPEYFPFVLLLVEKDTGYIIHFELLTPHPSVDEMVAGSGRKLLKSMIDKNIHPQEIQIRSSRLQPVLNKSLTGTSVHLEVRWKLPAVDEAMASLMDFLG